MILTAGKNYKDAHSVCMYVCVLANRHSIAVPSVEIIGYLQIELKIHFVVNFICPLSPTEPTRHYTFDDILLISMPCTCILI